jgi:hypothetical protein
LAKDKKCHLRFGVGSSWQCPLCAC